MTTVDLVKSLIIEPDEVRDLSHKYIDSLVEEKKRGVGVHSGLTQLDKVLNPLKPGQMRVVMGRPGNGKTSAMMHFTRVASTKYMNEDVKTAMPPIFVSAEMAVEEIALREISHIMPVDSLLLERGEYGDWGKVHDAIEFLYENKPIIYIGHSLKREGKRPRLSIENIWRAVENITDRFGLPPSLISLDYAQRLKLDKATRDRRLEVSEIVETVKDMSLAFMAPVVLGSQVGRQVDQKSPPVPDLADAKETSNLEETADSIISTMRPSKYYKVGDTIPGSTLRCEENLFFINVLKQRQGVSGVGVWTWFDMSISRLTDLEIERVDLEY